MTSLFQATGIMSHAISLLIEDRVLGKKTQILPNILPVAGNSSFTIMTYLKKLTGIKSLHTEQCKAVFSPRIIPSTLYRSSYQKRVKLSRFD